MKIILTLLLKITLKYIQAEVAEGWPAINNKYN